MNGPIYGGFRQSPVASSAMPSSPATVLAHEVLMTDTTEPSEAALGGRRRTAEAPYALAVVLRARVRDVMAADERVARRLARTGTSVELKIADSDAGVTLLLDRYPPRVADGPEPAEIRIELSADQAERFARGELNLPSEAAAGRLAFDGPIRAFLAIDPVLRARLRHLA